jgi:predicted nucleic acid-binding protein
VGWRPRSDAIGRSRRGVLILPDSSAWVEFFRRSGSQVHHRLADAIRSREAIAVSEIVIAEVLAGAQSPAEHGALRKMLLGFPLLRLETLADFEEAAALYRACRLAGETLRSITDCLIAVPAIRAGVPVLHADADFDKLARHTPLQVVPL